MAGRLKKVPPPYFGIKPQRFLIEMIFLQCTLGKNELGSPFFCEINENFSHEIDNRYKNIEIAIQFIHSFIKSAATLQL